VETERVTFCCVQCRLLQPATTSCVDCGAPSAPVELVRELLYYRDMKLLSHRDWGLITAFLAGSSLALPILMPFAIGSMIALGVNKLRNLRKRNAIAGITMPAPVTTPGARTLYGLPRLFRSTVPSLVDDAPVLLEHAVVRDRHGSVLLRRSEAVPFLLDVEHRGPMLVTGCARMMSSTTICAQRMKVRRGDPRLERMGVPMDLAIAGELEIARIVADGPGVAVTGVVEDEAVAELAFHRDGGSTPVMRGRLGAPILVEDPRLIAASL
jgi:hypothetical protein